MKPIYRGLIVVSLTLALAPALSMGATCVGAEAEGEGENLQWYESCGDPACSGFSPPTDVEACDSEAVGAVCGSEGAECYLAGDGCNVRLRCTDADPTTQPGGCPISVPSAKQDIRYLSDVEVDATLGRVLALQLARWQYTADPGKHDYLGFLIDEQAPSEAVLPRGDRVDLYGYTSLAIAAIQAQQRRIDALERELAALTAGADSGDAFCREP